MLIKNNLKLMLRCKALILVVLTMVAVTGMLTAVFKDIMVDNFEIKKCSTGYSFSKNCKYEAIKPFLENILKENGFAPVYYADTKGENAVKNGTTNIFIEITNSGCTVYSNNEYSNEGSIIKMIVNAVISQSSAAPQSNYITQQQVNPAPMPDSMLYYTIAYTVYFIWCALIVLGVVISSEKKNKIGLKFKASPVSSLNIYFARFISTSIVIILLIGISVAICTPLYSVSWQTPGLSFLIILLGCVASAAVSTVLFSLIKNVVVTIALSYCIIMYWGFFGGAFASYMHASFADGFRETSPIYYMIRSLVELNTMGQSQFTIPTIIILCTMIAVCVPLGVLAVKVRREK